MPAWDLTRSDYEQMAILRGQGLTWSVISARMGRSEGTLRVMFSRFQRGQVKAVPSMADRVVEAFETNPCPIRVIATTMGLSPRQVRNLLYRRGYDAEVRNELAQTLRRSAGGPTLCADGAKRSPGCRTHASSPERIHGKPTRDQQQAG